MSKLGIEGFKVKLLKMKSELETLELSSKASTETVVLDQSSVGRLSRIDAMQGQQMALESQRRRKIQRLQINAALSRIENNDFGYCPTCGDEIAEGRLLFNPAVIYCVNCSE